MTEQNPPSENDNTLDMSGKMFFHMVLADVVYSTKAGGITSMRTQFITQSPIDQFPADRITQLQNSAAATIRQKLTTRDAKEFRVYDVLFLALTPCGHMTTTEFYGQGLTTEQAVAPDETPVPDNVLTLKRDS